MTHASVEIYDTTLRDGTQAEGLSPSVSDKLAIARLIDEVGVTYIEGGWPGSNPKDDEFFGRAQTELHLRRAALVAFGSTCRAGMAAGEDPQLLRLLAAGTDVVCIVGKSWDYHVTDALRVDLSEALRMVADSVAFLVAAGRRVFFDAEHFFDGYLANPGFATAVLQAAADAGAERLILCDTNGGTLPERAQATIRDTATMLTGTAIGAHFHNDAGCAVANSLAAVAAGVQQIQGCMNGYGERTGNADLCSVIPNLVVKMGLDVVPAESLARLAPLAHHIAAIMNVPIDPRHPYVGASAFAHKAGLHTSGLARLPHAYEHVEPARVGNTARMLVSELMGRSTVLSIARHRGWDIDGESAQAVVDRVKELEHRGYYYEAADGSFELLVRNTQGWSQGWFEVRSFRVAVEQRDDGEVIAEATIVLTIDAERVAATRRGDGPLNALDRALKAALAAAYPDVETIRLTDYRVQDLDVSEGTAARVRVLMQCSDGRSTWGTVGVHSNIIEASWEALVDALVIGLLRIHEKRETKPSPADSHPATGDRRSVAVSKW